MNRKSAAFKARRRRSLINTIGGFMLVVAGALAVLLFYTHSRELQGWYGEYQLRMGEIQQYVLELRIPWLILLAVLLLYTLKSFWFPLPIPMLCFITGAVLPIYLSLAVNVAGLMILFSVRYYWGRRRGGGQVKKLLQRQSDIRDYLEYSRGSRPWVLFLFRLLPNFALNSVSQIFGAMHFDYTDFLLISLIGFLPKLVSYTIVGSQAFDPLSIPFLVPLIIIFALLGISTICVNIILSKQQKEKPL